MSDMRRRDFITLLGGATTWPLAARAQQAGKVIRIGFIGASLNTSAMAAQYQAFLTELHELGFSEGAESFYSLEGNMCGTAMRGADALPGSKATSRAKGTHRKLGGLVSGRQRRVRGTVRIGKARSRSR